MVKMHTEFSDYWKTDDEVTAILESIPGQIEAMFPDEDLTISVGVVNIQSLLETAEPKLLPTLELKFTRDNIDDSYKNKILEQVTVFFGGLDANIKKKFAFDVAFVAKTPVPDNSDREQHNA